MECKEVAGISSQQNCGTLREQIKSNQINQKELEITLNTMWDLWMS